MPRRVERRLDQMGRIVVPADVRRRLHIDTTTPLEMYVIDGKLMLVKVKPECAICGATNGLAKQIDDKHVCTRCLKVLVDGARATPRPPPRSSAPVTAGRRSSPAAGAS